MRSRPRRGRPGSLRRSWTGANERTCCVALHNDGARPVAHQEALETGQELGGEGSEGLVGLHHIERFQGRDPEVGEHRGHEFDVLPREEHRGCRARGLKGPDHGRELDRLGPGADDDRHLLAVWHHGRVQTPSSQRFTCVYWASILPRTSRFRIRRSIQLKPRGLMSAQARLRLTRYDAPLGVST